MFETMPAGTPAYLDAGKMPALIDAGEDGYSVTTSAGLQTGINVRRLSVGRAGFNEALARVEEAPCDRIKSSRF